MEATVSQSPAPAKQDDVTHGDSGSGLLGVLDLQFLAGAPGEPALRQPLRSDPRAGLKKFLDGTRGDRGTFNHKNFPEIKDTPHWATFCSCCGSQFMNEKGMIRNGSHGHAKEDYLTPLYYDGVLEQMLRVYQCKTVEELAKKFFYGDKPGIGRVIYSTMRANKPGVTMAWMPKEEAIKLLYPDPLVQSMADGYEIRDPDQGGVISILWLNA